MEDNLNKLIFLNGRRPQKNEMKDDLAVFHPQYPQI